MRPDSPDHIASVPHLQDAADVQLAAIRRMTVAQKLEAIHSLQQMAWDLKFMAVRREQPTLTDAEVHEQVRLLFLYGRA